MIGVYFATMLAVGWHYARRQSDAREYFIAAGRHIHPVLIGISMYATLLSAISYLGKPGEMASKGPVLLIGQVASIPFAYVIVGYWIIPRLMRQRVTSAYELLEDRLGLAGRLLGTGMFIVLRLVWMGFLVYIAAVAVTVIIGLDQKWVPLVAFVAGIVPVVTTSIGGLRTVVITDVLQSVLMLLGALCVIGVVTLHAGGLAWFPTTWSPHWDHQPWFSWDPHVRVSVFGATLSMIIWRVSTAGGDQTAVQRYMATHDVTAARRSYLVTEGVTLLVTIVLALVGAALLYFFSEPGRLGPGMSIAHNGDHLFPYFIANYLPIGISGVVIAALVASMSNVDSGVSAVSAVVMRDIVQRLGWRARDSAHEMRFTRRLAFGIGGLVVAMSIVMKYVPGNFLEVANKTVNLLAPPLFSLFILALWVPFATPLGAIVGCAYGVAAALLIAFWGPFTGGLPLSFQWIGPASLAVNLAVSVALSRWGPARDDRRRTMVAGLVAATMLALVAVAVLKCRNGA